MPINVAYMKHIVLYHWSLCACIVIGCVIRVYIGSCVATSQSGYSILYFGEHCENLRYKGRKFAGKMYT